MTVYVCINCGWETKVDGLPYCKACYKRDTPFERKEVEADRAKLAAWQAAAKEWQG